MRTLFSVEPAFTIDTCALNEMFDEDRPSNKKNFPGIWENVSDLILKGEIISHREVYEEIMAGPYDELIEWARQHKTAFAHYEFVREGEIIAEMGRKGFSDFVHQRKEKYNADPWLLAQAKRLKLKIITQEKKKGIADLPRACDEFGVPYLDVFGLIKEKEWVLHR
jgi:hypothetical protein